MHSNLARHLHSDECIKWIDDFEKCEKENPYAKYTGKCQDIHNKLSNCVLGELKKRREQGSENVKKRELEHHLKQNPQLAEKIKLLEELKKEASVKNSSKDQKTENNRTSKT